MNCKYKCESSEVNINKNKKWLKMYLFIAYRSEILGEKDKNDHFGID